MTLKFTRFTIPLVILLVCKIASHNYVLLPEKFVYQKGDTMNVHLMVGEVFDYEFERELQHSMTPRFELITNKGAQNFLPLMPDSSKPVAKIPIDFDELGLIVMQRKPSMIDETPSAFQRYLEEEHVNGISFDSTKWEKKMVKEKYFALY